METIDLELNQDYIDDLVDREKGEDISEVQWTLIAHTNVKEELNEIADLVTFDDGVEKFYIRNHFLATTAIIEVSDSSIGCKLNLSIEPMVDSQDVVARLLRSEIKGWNVFKSQEYYILEKRLLFVWGLSLYIAIENTLNFDIMYIDEHDGTPTAFVELSPINKFVIKNRLKKLNSPLPSKAESSIETKLSELLPYFWFHLSVEFAFWDKDLLMNTIELGPELTKTYGDDESF